MADIGRLPRPTPPPSSSAPAPSRPARRWWPCISSAAPRRSCWARRRWCWSPTRATSAARGPRRRHPVGGERRRPRHHRRRRRQGVRRPTPRATAGWSRPMPSAAGSIMSPPAPTARWRGRPASRRSCSRQGRAALDRGAVHRRRACVRAEGRAARGRPLQRRLDVVSERAGRARGAGVEGLASSRRLQPERAVPGDGDAGAGAARLARRRRQAHADVGLFGARALVRLDRGRQVARHLGLRAARALAVPGQGRPDGQAAARCSRRSPCASPPSPAIPSRRWSRSAMPTAPCCWCGSRTAPRCWPRSRARRRSPRSAGMPPARCWRWAPRPARPGVIDLA